MADNDNVQEQDLLINWSDLMSVKNGQMDADHKQLVRLINELYSAMWLDQAHTVIQTCLDSLKQYVRYHFQAEEELMAQASYPGLKAHQAVHGTFIDTVADMEKRWQEGDSEVSEQMMDLLQGWLVDHIMKVDMQYTEYLGQRA
jgi:hemerythrin-like metal-binding protein